MHQLSIDGSSQYDIALEIYPFFRKKREKNSWLRNEYYPFCVSFISDKIFSF